MGTTKEIFLEIKKYLQERVEVSQKSDIDLLALYVMMTWIYERFDVLPIVNIIGGRGTGKTILLNVLAEVCYRRKMYDYDFIDSKKRPENFINSVSLNRGTVLIDNFVMGRDLFWLRYMIAGTMNDYDLCMIGEKYKIFCPKIVASLTRDNLFGDMAILDYMVLIHMSSSSSMIHDGKRSPKTVIEINKKLIDWRRKEIKKQKFDIDSMNDIPTWNNRTKRTISCFCNFNVEYDLGLDMDRMLTGRVL